MFKKQFHSFTRNRGEGRKAVANNGELVDGGALGLRIEQLENTVKELQKALKQQYQAAASGGGDGEMTLEQLKSMGPDEINARWKEVQKLLAKGGK